MGKNMNNLHSIWKIKDKIQNLATNGLAGEFYQLFTKNKKITPQEQKILPELEDQ